MNEKPQAKQKHAEHVEQLLAEKLPGLSHKAMKMAGDSEFLPKLSHLFTQTAPQVETLMEQVDRLRAIMREKELELLKIRHENILLKQIERRQQKEIMTLDCQNHDAPKLIRGLREEIAGLKTKIKTYFAQLNTDSRSIRSLTEECRKLKEHGSRLEALVASKELLERETLSKQIVESSNRLMEQERLTAEVIRRSDMVEKNITNENRQLRMRINNYEKENSFFKEKTRKLDDIIRDKEKEIASLSIYRYNAVHKKVENAVCKKCEQRNKLETEVRRRQAIIDKLPLVSDFKITLENSSTAIASFIISPSNAASFVDYSRLVLRYSIDPTFMHDSETIVLPKMRSSNSPDLVTAVGEHRITGLLIGKVYHFQMCAGHEDIDGPMTQSVSILVDELPLAPLKPTVTINMYPPLIILRLCAAKVIQGSPPFHFQVYHSNDEHMKESFLIAEVEANTENKEEVTQIDCENGVTYMFRNPQIATPHYFKIAAVNLKGAGPCSEISDCVVIDMPPSQPTKPELKKITTSSVSIRSNSKSNCGSDVECWRIIFSKRRHCEGNLNAELQPLATTTIFAPASLGSTPNALEHIIDSLEPGSVYSFAVVAINACGESDASEASEEIILDEMIPVAPRPDVDIISPTAIRVYIPDVPDLSSKITGIRIAAIPETSELKTIYQKASLSDKSTVLEGLEFGCSYKVGANYVGHGFEEGAVSTTVPIVLAAAVPLPLTPSPPLPSPDKETKVIDIENDKDKDEKLQEVSAPVPINKGPSRSSLLTIAQKVQNMHDGHPAHKEPFGSQNLKDEKDGKDMPGKEVPAGSPLGAAAPAHPLKKIKNVKK